MLASGVWLAIGGTFLFALKSIFIKLAYAAGTDAETLLALRMLLAAPFYGAMLWWLKRSSSAEPAGTSGSGWKKKATSTPMPKISSA